MFKNNYKYVDQRSSIFNACILNNSESEVIDSSESGISSEACSESFDKKGCSLSNDSSSSDIMVWHVEIPSKVLEEIDVFVWDFDLSLTRFHTISRNDRVLDRKSLQSREPLMSSNICNPLSEWYAGKWLLNPEYFVHIVKTLVDVHKKKIAIVTHHSYKYFSSDASADAGSGALELRLSGEKRKLDETSSRSADGSGSLLAGADLVLQYLRIAFETFGEDVNRYFHQGNIVALDCINHPGKLEHLLHVLGGLGFRDERSGLIKDSLISEVKADGRKYLRAVLFDDDFTNIDSINRGLSKYVDAYREIDNVRIRGIVLPTVKGGFFCDETLWLRGFMAFPPEVVDRVGFTSNRLSQLNSMLELEDVESSSSGEFVDDGYDS